MTPGALRLSVQYASAGTGDAPSRPQVRRWVATALDRIAAQAAIDATTVPAAATLTIRFVDEPEGRELNRTFRGRDYATNVLTFPLSDAPDAIEADIVVCLPVVGREAAEQGKRALDHAGHLVVHGVLHAAGYDHEDGDDADAMEALETAVLARFRIADPYR